MCGIVGVLNLHNSSPPLSMLKHLSDTLAHRGPDSSGVHVDGPMGMGHRRLSILDLSDASSQPMFSGDGRYALVYNGEIYNYRELRRELEAQGQVFYSSGDTEVLLQAFAAWGPDCLLKLNGMFAFAVWDRLERSLFLARDRYGLKPLYYARVGNAFLFASEQKAILAHPDAPRDLDLEALVEYFTFQNILSDKTLLQGIKLLQPGCSALVRQGASDPSPQLQRWWRFNFVEPYGPVPDEEEYMEELDRLFQQAVERQLVSDAPLGAYLSGGLDSGAVVQVASQHLPGFPTFTCGFDLHSATGLELAYDERERAEHMSYLFGTEHYEVVLKAGDMERVLPALAWHLEEPRVGQCYPNYYVARLASKFVKVTLSGTGGDELFGGYPWRYYRGAGCETLDTYMDAYYSFWQRLVPETMHKDFFAPIWNQVAHVSTRTTFKSLINGWTLPASSPEHFMNLSLNFEAQTFLHGLLVVEDKLSMAHGLETRAPFLDNDLVDFAMQLPVRMKVRNLRETLRLNENEPGPKTHNYFLRTGDGKVLLRNTLARHVPSIVTEAAKQGFSAPDASWFRGKSMEYVRRTLFNPKAAVYDLLDRKTVQGLVEDHLSGKENRRLLIWSLLNVNEWLEQFHLPYK